MPPSNRGSLRFSVRLIVVSIVLLATLVTASVAIGLQYYFSRSMAIDAAVTHYQTSALSTSDYIEEIDRNAVQVTRLLARYPLLNSDTGRSSELNELLAEVMRNNPIFYGIYLGTANGDLYEVINLDNGRDVRKSLHASAEDRWVVVSVTSENHTRVRHFAYYTDQFQLRATRTEPSVYDARQRLWFSSAQRGKVTKSDAYLFQYAQVPGLTYSIKLPGGDVLGIDVTLKSFSEYLQRQPLSKDSEIYVYERDGALLATNQLINSEGVMPKASTLPLSDEQRSYLAGLGTLKVSNEADWPPIDFAVAGEPRGYSVDTIRLVAQMLDLKIQFINGYSWSQLLNKYRQGEIDIIQPLAADSDNNKQGYVSAPLINLPYALALRKGAADVTSIKQLYGKTLAIPRGWSLISILKKTHPEILIAEVATTKAALEAVRDGKAFATMDSSAILHYTANQYFIQGLAFDETIDLAGTAIPTSYHLMVSPHHQQLGKIIDLALAQITAEQRALLQHKWLNGKDQNGAAGTLASVPYKALLDATISPSALNQLQQQTINHQDFFSFVAPLDVTSDSPAYFAVLMPADKVLAPGLQRVKLSISITAACLLLLLPIAWLFAEPIIRPIRQLAATSVQVKERRYANVKYQSSTMREMDDLSLSMVDMARSIQGHEQKQRDLMDSFIQLIANAIDQKSPYTGGHCARVPQLALMLAAAAEKSEDPRFKAFQFHSDDEYREFKIAAWLHDCGKITVPEHIVDKGSKLETIYNRIHEIRMRFEVLWRDAEIVYLQAIAAEPANREAHRFALLQRQQVLQENFAFVAKTNVGGEFLSDADQQQLRDIGETTWLRHFDNRLGLSPVEELNLPQQQVTLPAVEKLLADKPEHIGAHTQDIKYDAKLHINMDVPALRYNQGEIYNLSVSRGTLTTEDRFRINEHIISTIRMLEQLPFPEELSRVPRYASTHHETLIGTGYPRKLSAEQLSLPERILAVADIFEALTAADRPYKKAKPVSEAIAILHKFAVEQHIDQDVFELFLISGVYRDYAEQFLPAEQIDAVDITPYLRNNA